MFSKFDYAVLASARVTVGDDTFFGPADQIYSAAHALDAALSRR